MTFTSDLRYLHLEVTNVSWQKITSFVTSPASSDKLPILPAQKKMILMNRLIMCGNQQNRI